MSDNAVPLRRVEGDDLAPEHITPQEFLATIQQMYPTEYRIVELTLGYQKINEAFNKARQKVGELTEELSAEEETGS